MGKKVQTELEGYRGLSTTKRVIMCITLNKDHNRQLDHMANFGAEGVATVIVEGFKKHGSMESRTRFSGWQQKRSWKQWFAAS